MSRNSTTAHTAGLRGQYQYPFLFFPRLLHLCSCLAKILRGVCAGFILGISFPIAGQAQTNGGSSDYGSGSDWQGSFNRRHFSARRLGSYGDWRQSFWPHWGWDMAASVAAMDPFYYSYYCAVSYDEVPIAGAVAYCLQRFRTYDPASGTYLGLDGHRHPCP